MSTLFIVKGSIGILILFIIYQVIKIKPKVVFGIRYRIEKIDEEQVILTDMHTGQLLGVEASLLYEDETFSSGDIVQMHSIGQVGDKTIQKIKKV